MKKVYTVLPVVSNDGQHGTFSFSRQKRKAMKTLLPLFLIAVLNTTPVPLLVIDMNGKKPLRPATEFSIDQCLSRSFPIYAADLNLVIEATEKAAKLIDQKRPCGAVDTVRANHTLLIVRTDCSSLKNLTVRYVTRIDEQNFLCDFELLKNAEDFRTAQIKLLDFAAYLSQ